MSDDQQSLRTEALESLLREKGLVDSSVIDGLVERYENDLGPMNGARVVARAWLDADYKARLLQNAPAALAELDIESVEEAQLVVVENTPQVHNVVVCTLCSCYPWSVLGLPPSWYKDPAYRSRIVREPRVVLGEFGLTPGDDVEVRVWDSSAEVRYMVLPQLPAGAEGLSEHELVELATRDSMIGTALARPPA